MSWRPSADRETLHRRAELLHRVREFFRTRGFLEVETPVLSRDVVIDAHIEPVRAGDAFLQTSPEFAHKRLLAAHGEPIFEITRAFRGEESGRLHRPEFTMIEWYAPGDHLDDGMSLVESLIRQTLGTQSIERINYDNAFQEALGTHVLSLATPKLIELATPFDPPAIDVNDRDAWLNFLLVKAVEPMLADRKAIFVHDYPASQAALARIRDDDPPVAERFELYLDGIEICNGYHELTDADELRRRQLEQNRLRVSSGKAALPENNRLLAAMDAGLPSACGVALGFDRLAMIALGKNSIAEVMAFADEM